MIATKHYEKLIEMGCFSYSQAVALLGNSASASAMIQAYLRKGYIERVKRDLYAVISLETRQPIPSRYQIGCSLFTDACISHHSAFEVYGYANQVFYETYVATNGRFSDFEYNGVRYHRIAYSHFPMTTNHGNVRVTTIEQTVVDSIRDFEKVGGLEETLRCIVLIPSLNELQLLDILKQYGNGFLYQKVGYLLEALGPSFGLSDAFFTACRAHAAHSKRYLLKDKQGLVYQPQWGLYTPPSIHKLMNKGGNDDAL